MARLSQDHQGGAGDPPAGSNVAAAHGDVAKNERG